MLADAEGMNAPFARTADLVERAERAYRLGQFEEVLDYAAQADVEAAKERDQAIGAMMQRFEEALLRARVEGTDTRSAEKLIARARELLRAKKYRQAMATALQSEAEVERIGLQQSMAKEAVEMAERKASELGNASTRVADLVEASRKAYSDADYVKALDTAVRARDLIADFRILIDEVNEVREKAQSFLQIASEVGADAGKFERSFQDGESALEEGEVERARAAFSDAVEWGYSLLRTHLREELVRGEALAATSRRHGVDPTPALNKLSEAKGQIDEDRFVEAAASIRAAREAATTALAAKLHGSLQEAADNVSHAKKLGSDSRAAEALLKEASERILRGEYDNAMDVVKNALERVESAKIVEKRFVDLTYKADTTITNGRKFGIDMKAAEAKLDQAMKLRGSNFVEANKAAEEAYRLAWEATEAFAPSMKGFLDVAPARMNEWVDATLTVENEGKGAAKDVRVRILGDAEAEGLQEIPAVRPQTSEALRIRLKMTASGSVPLAIQIISHRVFDGKEYNQEMIAQIDVSEVGQEKAKRLVADLETRCPICKGLIKKGFKVTRCGCGRDFHELCASRVGRCPVCFRGLQASGG
jgi:tetratricopeptide (TPR) repeat protein